MSECVCPICGEKYDKPNGCKENISRDDDFVDLFCNHFNFRFCLHRNIYYMEEGTEKEKLLNLITEHLIHNNMCQINGGKKLWYFYFNDVCDGIYSRYPEYINLDNNMKNYPTQAIDIANRALVNISNRYHHYGDVICIFWNDRRLCFEHEINNSNTCGVMKLLADLGYVKEDSSECYIITATGWQKIDELRKQEQVLKQGFIAMSFRDETKPIREAFRTAITSKGYSVIVIDEKEHNNQIVPEILYEIERSKFMVVDITYPNHGAYYEAGYAQGLGKEVIICCRKKEFNDKENPNKPHFDISQKVMIVWEDEEDLVMKLKRRIEATIK